MFKKKPSRKELEEKIEALEREKDTLMSKWNCSEISSRNASNELNSARKQINQLSTENKTLKERNEELEKQNAVFRQYFHLDEEPSQETKDKMYLDQKYREMDREIIRLQAIVESDFFRRRCELEGDIFRLGGIAGSVPFIARPTLGAISLPRYSTAIYP